MENAAQRVGSGYSGQVPTEPTRVNGVTAYTNDIDKGLEACGEKLSKLTARLEAILRPDRPDVASAGTASVPRAIESPLAERQVAHKNALAAFCDRIDGLLSRIDL